VTASWNDNDSNGKMEYTDDETKKKEGRSNKGRNGIKSAARKSNKITSTPSRLGMQVTPNSKKTGGQLQDPPKKSRYKNEQLEVFFGPGMRVTAPGKQKDWPTRIKTAAVLEDGSNKKARLEEEHSDEEKEGERRFAVNLEAMDTPLRRKGSSHIQEAKKALETTKTTTNTEMTIKKKGEKASFAEAASAPAPEVAKKPGFLYRKCIVGFAIRV
jgi:hypothetical protein